MSDPSTLQAMQTLLEDLHELGDAVLRHNYVHLRSLQPHGVNSEGKPIAGIPDSFVGASPTDCTTAVEYTTTKAGRLAKKFQDDLDKVIVACPRATEIILCTNRPKDEAVESALRKRASASHRTLLIVWGEDIARTIDDHRQDLRERYLGIPLGSLTAHSLVPALRARADQAVQGHLGGRLVSLQNRLQRRPFEMQFARLRPTRRDGITLVLGDSGQGKTTWSCATSLELSIAEPTIWFPASSVRDEGDALNNAIATAAYGVADPTKVLQLARLLHATGQKLMAFIDAIDEASDYRSLQRSLKGFLMSSVLAKHTHLILTCRTEAIAAFDQVPANVLPREEHSSSGRRLNLPPLREDEAENFLRRLGATREEVSTLLRALPKQFSGNPFYLRLARVLQESGELPANPSSWISAFAEHYAKDVRGRLTSVGTAPTIDYIRAAFGEIAHAALVDPQGADPSRVRGNALIVTHEDGEGTFLERSVQSGLLVRNGKRLRFCHALLTEYFCAHNVAASAATACHKVEAIARLPNARSVAAHLVAMDPATLTALVEKFPFLLLFPPSPSAACAALFVHAG